VPEVLHRRGLVHAVYTNSGLNDSMFWRCLGANGEATDIEFD
jgi:hypothetical protein